MNKLNNTKIVSNTEIGNNINRNSSATNKNQALPTTRTITHLGKLSLRFFAIVLSIAAFTFLPAQAQEQTIEDASTPQVEKQEITHQDVEEKLITKGDKGIPGQYIVVFKDSAAGSHGEDSLAPELSDEMIDVHGGKIKSIFRHALNGYAAEMTEKEALAVSKDERVAYVEQRQMVSPSTIWEENVSGWDSWGLDRINQRFRPLDCWYTYNNTGAGVDVYVIDSGVKTDHPEFGGRATAYNYIPGGNGQDCTGHGTHVAGTIAGRYVGVAKQARIISVRVFGCSEADNRHSNLYILRAVEWITWVRNGRPAVVNMSLSGEPYQALDDAIRRSINTGITYVVAAGNDGIDANNVSPARVREAITVGATDRYDNRANAGYYGASNYGTALDLFAPGNEIRSASHANTGFVYKSGTSMAAPHVAGAAAILLQYYPNASPAQVHDVIVRTATTGVLRNPGVGSPNRLFYSLMLN